MTHLIPAAAVEAAMRAWYPKGWKPEDYEHHESELRAAIAAALPHLAPISNAEINESMLEELKALRAAAQPLLIAANKGAARIKQLDAETDSLIASQDALLQERLQLNKQLAERDARIKQLEDERIETDDLVVAMAQLLDDMQEHGLSVCAAAKAQARVAMEPFLRRLPQEDLPTTMTLEAAVATLEQTHDR